MDIIYQSVSAMGKIGDIGRAVQIGKQGKRSFPFPPAAPNHGGE